MNNMNGRTDYTHTLFCIYFYIIRTCQKTGILHNQKGEGFKATWKRDRVSHRAFQQIQKAAAFSYKRVQCHRGDIYTRDLEILSDFIFMGGKERTTGSFLKDGYFHSLNGPHLPSFSFFYPF